MNTKLRERRIHVRYMDFVECPVSNVCVQNGCTIYGNHYRMLHACVGELRHEQCRAMATALLALASMTCASGAAFLTFHEGAVIVASCRELGHNTALRERQIDASAIMPKVFALGQRRLYWPGMRRRSQIAGYMLYTHGEDLAPLHRPPWRSAEQNWPWAAPAMFMATLFLSNLEFRGARMRAYKEFFEVLLAVMVGRLACASVCYFPAGLCLTHGFAPPLPAQSNSLVLIARRPLWGFHLVVIEDDD